LRGVARNGTPEAPSPVKPSRHRSMIVTLRVTDDAARESARGEIRLDHQHVARTSGSRPARRRLEIRAPLG
jgi:hypothetical protein